MKIYNKVCVKRLTLFHILLNTTKKSFSALKVKVKRSKMLWDILQVPQISDFWWKTENGVCVFIQTFLKAYTVQTRNQMSHERHTKQQGMFINSIHVHTFVDYLWNCLLSILNKVAKLMVSSYFLVWIIKKVDSEIQGRDSKTYQIDITCRYTNQRSLRIFPTNSDCLLDSSIYLGTYFKNDHLWIIYLQYKKW